MKHPPFSALTILLLIITLSSCASLGSKTIYSSASNDYKTSLSKVYLAKPVLYNQNLKEEAVLEVYFQEIMKLFHAFNVDIIESSTVANFNTISQENGIHIPEASDCEIVIFGEIKRVSAMGQTRDYKVEYKIVSTEDYELKYHCKYSSTFGQSYVILPGMGLPPDEVLYRDAIKASLFKIEKDFLKK